MTSKSILAHLWPWGQVPTWHDRILPAAARHLNRPDLHHLSQNLSTLPRFVQECPVAMRYLHFLGPLAWDAFPERDLLTNWGAPTMPYAPFVAACLVKLEQGLICMSHLRRYLVEHPALVGVLGFPLLPPPDIPGALTPMRVCPRSATLPGC